MSSDKAPESVNPFGDGPKLSGEEMDRQLAARKAQASADAEDDPSSVNPFGGGRRKTATQIEAEIAAKKTQQPTGQASWATAGGKDMGPPLPKVLVEHNRKKTLDDMANLEKIIAMAKSEKLAQANAAPEFARHNSLKRSPEEMQALERNLHQETHQRAEAAAQKPSYVSDSKEGHRGTVDEIDGRREKGRRTRLLMKTLEMRDWMYGLLKRDVGAEQKSKGPASQAADFMTSLEDGIMLCKLVKAVFPSENVHIEEGPKANPFYKRDNVSNFLKAATKLGVPVQSMFMTDDLVSRKNDDMVVSALMSFAREAMKHGVAPPLIIQYEMDIDEENHEDDNNGQPIIMVEEAQPDETEDEKHKREEIEKLTIQIKELESDIKDDDAAAGDDEDDAMSPPPTGKTVTFEEEKESSTTTSQPTTTTTSSTPPESSVPSSSSSAPSASSPSKLNAFAQPFVPGKLSPVAAATTSTTSTTPSSSSSSTTPNKSSSKSRILLAGSPAVTAAEQQQRAKKQDKKAASRARREKAKAKFQQLKEAQILEGQLVEKHSGEKYKAIKGDAIDEAVQRAVNDPDSKFYQFIRIRRAKKLGKAATAKRSKREKEGGGIYRVGSAHKVHVRLMQEMLFVRQGNQWVDFNLFVHDQIEADNRAHQRVHGSGDESGSGPKMVWVPKGSTSPPPSSSTPSS